MRDENILKIESECKIIRPIFRKNQFNKLDDFEFQNTKKTNYRNALNKDFSFIEDDLKDFSQLFENINKSKSFNLENEEKDENDEEYLINSEKIKKKSSIIEIFNILSQPIIGEYSKSRNTLKKYKSNLYNLYENNDKQNNEILNIENKNKTNNNITVNNKEQEETNGILN